MIKDFFCIFHEIFKQLKCTSSRTKRTVALDVFQYQVFHVNAEPYWSLMSFLSPYNFTPVSKLQLESIKLKSVNTISDVSEEAVIWILSSMFIEVRLSKLKCLHSQWLSVFGSTCRINTNSYILNGALQKSFRDRGWQTKILVSIWKLPRSLFDLILNAYSRKKYSKNLTQRKTSLDNLLLFCALLLH